MLSLHSGRKSQKSQSSLIVLVSLVGIFSILLISLLFQSGALQSQVVKSILLSRVSKYLDITKGFTQSSALLSSHAACYDIAYKGGHIPEGTRTWICNEPWGPTVDEVRFFLGKETLEFLNRYAASYNVKDPTVLIKNFTCANYNVDESSVIGGKVDERFNTEAFGGQITVILEEDNTTAKNSFDLEISRIRFWFMYRIFKKWSETTTLPQDICAGLPLICGCNPSLGRCEATCPAFREYALNQIEKSRKYLESLFNDPEYINCTAIMDCCMTQIGSNTDSREMCLIWHDWPCGGCNREEPGTLCINSILSGEEPQTSPISISGKTDPGKTRFLQFNVGVSIAWIHPCLCKYSCAPECKCVDECGNYCVVSTEPRGTITATFSCVDKKYSLSV
jgi:hypothetical protein